MNFNAPRSRTSKNTRLSCTFAASSNSASSKSVTRSDESDYRAPHASDDGKLVLASLTIVLIPIEASGLAIGDGKATLVLQLVNGSFRPSLGLRGNLALSRSMSSKQSLIPPRAPAIPLPGATRLLIPITITAGASRTK